MRTRSSRVVACILVRALSGHLKKTLPRWEVIPRGKTSLPASGPEASRRVCARRTEIFGEKQCKTNAKKSAIGSRRLRHVIEKAFPATLPDVQRGARI